MIAGRTNAKINLQGSTRIDIEDLLTLLGQYGSKCTYLEGGACVAGKSKDTDKDGYPDCADACPKKKDVNMATLPAMKALKGSIKSSVGS